MTPREDSHVPRTETRPVHLRPTTRTTGTDGASSSPAHAYRTGGSRKPRPGWSSNRPAAFLRSDAGTGHHVVEQVGLCGPELEDEGQHVEQAEKVGRVLGGPADGAHVVED